MKKVITGLLYTGLFLVALALAAYFIALNGLKELDQKARDNLGGLYLQTKQGMLSYTREGPINAPAIILVHGFSTPKFVWDQITPSLVAKGYQVITFDHLGRGFSDRPAGPYNAELYQSELAGLIAKLELKTPLTLVGYSMGGANVVDYAASHPEQIQQLILIAPAGYMDDPDSSALAAKPIIGEWLATVFGNQYAGTAIQSEIEEGLAPKDMYEKFQKQASFKGYTEALLSTLRHYPMHDLAHRYKIVGKAGIPVLAIWGTADEVVPYSGAAEMAADVPQLKLEAIEDGNHNIAYAQAQLVANKILGALQGRKGD
jgi:pimeloyl-ACP methyl ester carboxylesterase